MEKQRKRKVLVGSVPIGGDAPVSVQSMLNRPVTDVAANLAQARQLEQAGCDIIRLAVPNMDGVRLIETLKREIRAPLVADIHFDYRLAIESVRAGADKIRINPGNIGSDDHVKAVADVCASKKIPIRVGVNGGSLPKQILAKYGGPTPAALVESGLYHISLLKRYGVEDIVLSLKSSDVQTMYQTYLLADEACDYPLHLGVTEAGTPRQGLLCSAAGIGGLLLRGIGNTIRISLTDEPVEEVRAGLTLLRALRLRKGGVRIISCPTCGRTKIDLISLAKQAEEALSDCPKELTVAIMGCAVNGPGEAREADLGIACGEDGGVLFRRGNILRKVPAEELLDELLKEIERF